MASYKSRLLLHLNQGSAGSVMQSELLDYPGISITDHWDKKKKKTHRTISYQGKEFPNISTAIEHWNCNTTNNINSGGLNGESNSNTKTN